MLGNEVTLGLTKKSAKEGRSVGLTAAVWAASVGGASLAQADAASEVLRTVLLPEAYELKLDGSAQITLADGRTVHLQGHQFVILEGGLLLVVDETAQLALSHLPVQGAFQALTDHDLTPVRADGQELVKTSKSQPVWSGDGLPEFKFDQLSMPRAEVAQNPADESLLLSQDSPGTSAGGPQAAVSVGGLGLGAAVVAFGALDGGDSPSPARPTATVIGAIPAIGDPGPSGSGTVSVQLSNVIVFEDSDGTIEKIEAIKSPSGLSFSPETANGLVSGTFDGVSDFGPTTFTSNTFQMKFRATDNDGLTVTTAASVSGQLIIPDSAVAINKAITIEGGGADDYIGYTAANPTARDALTFFGWEEQTTSTVNLGNGNNYLLIGDQALFEATLVATGGTGDDTIEVGEYFANNNGDVTFDMRAGGDNTFTSPDRLALSATFAYMGGPGDDSISTLSWLANDGGSATFDMSAGGSNALTATGLAGASGTLSYTGGPGDDSLSFGSWLGSSGGDVTIDMSAGGSNSLAATDYAGVSGNLSYTGGDGDDTLTFASWFANNSRSGTYATTIDMSLGGDNSLTAVWQPAKSGDFTYIGGGNRDELEFGNDFGSFGAEVEIDMSAGGRNSLVAGHDSGRSGNISYTGGVRGDSLTFGARPATNGGELTIDMSAGGNNSFTAGERVAESGTLTYTGGTGDDDITFGFLSAVNGANVTIDNQAGGSNTFSTGYSSAESGNLTYIGGAGRDSVEIGNLSVVNGGNLQVDMSEGGRNDFTAGYQLAQSGTFTYTGGAEADTLTIGNRLAEFGGDATFDMRLGGDNTLVVGSTAAVSGSITYQGGLGSDLLTFGGDVARSGFVSLDLGDDVVFDQVTLQGAVALGSAVNGQNLTIQNFDPTRDVLDLAHTSVDITAIGANTTEVASTAGTSIRITLFGATTSEMAETGVIV